MVKMRKDESSGTFIKTYERGFPVGFRATLQVSHCINSAAQQPASLG